MPGGGPGVVEGQVVERKLAAIFAADVVGYSHLMQLDEMGTLRALRASRAIVDRLISQHRGRIFTTAGDSVPADFASAVDAVECALAVAGWWQWISPPSMGLIASQQAGGPGMSAAIPAEGTPARNLPAQRLSIVVLPFANLSNDPEQEYFADGITEDLTTDVSRIAGAVVIARNSAFSYKGKPVDPKQIGRELGVRYILQGSVRRSGSQIRINAVLINAETDAQL